MLSILDRQGIRAKLDLKGKKLAPAPKGQDFNRGICGAGWLFSPVVT